MLSIVRLRLEQARVGGHPSSMAEAAAARDGKRDLAEQFQARARAADGDPPPVADLKAQIRAYREIPAGYDHDPGLLGL